MQPRVYQVQGSSQQYEPFFNKALLEEPSALFPFGQVPSGQYDGLVTVQQQRAVVMEASTNVVVGGPNGTLISQTEFNPVTLPITPEIGGTGVATGQWPITTPCVPFLANGMNNLPLPTTADRLFVAWGTTAQNVLSSSGPFYRWVTEPLTGLPPAFIQTDYDGKPCICGENLPTTYACAHVLEVASTAVGTVTAQTWQSTAVYPAPVSVTIPAVQLAAGTTPTAVFIPSNPSQSYMVSLDVAVDPINPDSWDITGTVYLVPGTTPSIEGTVGVYYQPV